VNDAQAALVSRHLDLARRAASLYHRRLGGRMEYDDLVALANVGLAEAASRYDPGRGASFSTFAWYRVTGAIVDGVRRATNLPRRVWRQLMALQATADYLEAQSDRADQARSQAPAPTTADRLRAIRDAMSAIKTMYVVALEQVPADRLASDDERPDRNLGTERLRERLAAALATLPERERALIDMHYVQGKNLLEAGEELGLSKSWASRLHARAIDRLRAQLTDTS